MVLFQTKTIEELEKERDKLVGKVEEKEKLDKVKQEIKELKGKSSGFNKEKVLDGWKGIGKGFLSLMKGVGKATTKFAERQKELEANARKSGTKKGKQKQSNSFGFNVGDVPMEKAFGIKPPKKHGRDKDAYIF